MRPPHTNTMIAIVPDEVKNADDDERPEAFGKAREQVIDVSASPRSIARQPSSTPPANTGASSVVASDPIIGMKFIITMMT